MRMPACILIGARGSGKSTVGAQVAAALEWSFVDLDDMALELTGAECITHVFENPGEHAWRQAEASALEAACRMHDVVIAAGGGAAAIDPPRQVLMAARRDGRVRTIWLRCESDTLRSRLSQDVGDRPSLTGEDPEKEIVNVAAARAEAYRHAADSIIDADGPIEGVAAAVLDCIRAMD